MIWPYLKVRIVIVGCFRTFSLQLRCVHLCSLAEFKKVYQNMIELLFGLIWRIPGVLQTFELSPVILNMVPCPESDASG
jgi:hypothetical protein